MLVNLSEDGSIEGSRPKRENKSLSPFLQEQI